MEHREPETERTVSLLFFLKILKRHWLLLLAVPLLVATVLGFTYRLGFYTPVYSSRSQFYVSNVSTDTFLYSSGQTAGAKEMVENCARFLRGSVVLDEVLAEVGANQTAENRAMLNSMIEVDKDATSSVFAVTVSSTNPEQNLKVAQAIEKVLPKHCDEFNNQNMKNENGKPSDGTDAEADEGGSQMLKVIDSGVLDHRADNRFSIIKIPFFAWAVTLILLCLILVFISLNDMTIYGKEDLAEKLPSNISTFGVIPHWPVESGLGRKGKRVGKKHRILRGNAEDRLVGRNKAPFDVSEAFRMLGTNVTFCSTGEKGCTVGVVSSLAASGKSFVMANLAVSLSRLIDKRVLLVDADMRAPMQHKIFRLENKKGLSNLLAGQCGDFREVKHTVDGLDVISAGTLPPNPTELLSGPNMEKLMEEWKQEYDYILIDLPPIGEVADVLAVSRFISGYLSVLRSGISDARMVREQCAMMFEHGAKIFGYVLTDVMEEHLQNTYYSKYSKYSTYYRSESEQETDPAAGN